MIILIQGVINIGPTVVTHINIHLIVLLKQAKFKAVYFEVNLFAFLFIIVQAIVYLEIQPI